MKKDTRKQLEEKAQAFSLECEAHAQALNAFLNWEVSPAFRNKDYTLRIAYPERGHGGIVLVTFHPHDSNQKPYTSAYFWERWFQSTREHAALSAFTKESRELLELAYKAQTWIIQTLSALEKAA